MAVDITGLSAVVANMLGVSEAAGGAFCTLVVFMACTGFLSVTLRDNYSNNVFLATTIFVMGLATLIGWLDVWWILMLVAVVAIFGAFKIGDR